VKIYRATLFFRASASCSKILIDKIYFNTVKNSRASTSCSKILNSKKYIQYCEFRAPSVFQGKHKLLKTPECKKYIQYSEKFLGNSVFQGKRELLKNPE